MMRFPHGGNIDRNKPLNFRFNNKKYTGYQGDTLASALLANDVTLIGRSFKYHRPRGIVSAGLEEFNAIVQLESGAYHEPNVRATQIELYEGLSACSQNVWPSLRFDVYSVFSLFSKLLPAGFYYKTFIAPSWARWEGMIRRAAGLGAAPKQTDPSRYQQHNVHCDCLVVGGGPSGLSAALKAAESGQCVLLMDDQPVLGGSLLACVGQESAGARTVLEQTISRLRELDNVSIVNRCQVFAYYDHNVLAAVERVNDHQGHDIDKAQARQRLWKIRTKEVVLATGAIERPLTFINNDRPGIMLSAAVRQYMHRYAVSPGKQVLVVTNNNSAYKTAIDLKTAGSEVAVIDTRFDPEGKKVRQAQEQNIRFYAGYAIVKVHGLRTVSAITIAPIDQEGKVIEGNSLRLPCDLVAMSGGWNPTVHLYSQSGGKLEYDDNTCCFIPAQANQNVRCVGAANGDFGNDYSISPFWQMPDQASDKQWVDFQYDITVADIEQAARENFISVEHFKRYTGTGMCVDQGKTGNVTALAVLGEITGRKIPEVGTTRFRPPFHPVTIGAMVGQTHGEFYTPQRQMPAHPWHANHGAVFEDAGGWQRPSYYLMPGESVEQAITREVKAVRNAAGLFEGSPLGKIDVQGKDAAEFLNRIYLNNMMTLKPGKVRYGLMLNENGIIIDDGVLTCLADNHYQVGTTSAGARRILLWMEEWLQCEWPHLDVRINALTQQWAVCTLTGPKARQLLQKLPTDIDCSAEAFPHMSVKEGVLAGVAARIFRVSFTGEVSYEINVPADYGLSLWQVLMEVGCEYGVTAYGIEALEILRTEKGYLHIGTDTDGTSCPDDVGWGGPVKKKSVDFIGKRSLMRPANQEQDRLQFVGLAASGEQTLPTGSHLISEQQPSLPVATQGYVTSSFFSPTLNKPVALGLLKAGRSRMGETVYAYDQGKVYTAEIVSPVFYDSEGGRLNA
jgi:sarcosine oxidase, subunit alpha